MTDNRKEEFRCELDQDDYLVVGYSQTVGGFYITAHSESRSISIFLDEEKSLQLAHIIAPEHVPAPQPKVKVGQVYRYRSGETVTVLHVGEERAFVHSTDSSSPGEYSILIDRLTDTNSHTLEKDAHNEDD